MSSATDQLIVKEVDFQGATLLGVQTEDGKIYAGVSYVCNGIGFSKDQKDRQVKNIQSDIVLKKGCVKFDAGVFDQNNSTLAIEINYLPLWLAKISITPAMQRDNSEVTSKLIEYQVKAKDVLAEAFLTKNNYFHKIPQTLSQALLLASELAAKNEELEANNLLLQQAIEESKPKLTYLDKILNSKDSINISQIAEDYGFTAQKFNQLLYQKGIQYKVGGQWLLFKDHKGKGYTDSDTFPYIKKDGTDGVNVRTKWTQKGRIFLYEHLKKSDILPLMDTVESDFINNWIEE